MKRFLFMVSLIVAGALAQPAAAQVRVHVNIDLQPSWGPSGYDYAEYYYMPAMDMYYYVPAREYIYLQRGRWVRTRYVPVHYRHVDFYRTYKVVINERDPFRYHDMYRTRYAQYRTRYDQPVWRDVRDRHNDNRYDRSREWNNQRRNDRPDNRQWNNGQNNERPRNDNNGWNNRNEQRRNDNNRWNNEQRKNGNNHGHNEQRRNSSVPGRTL